MPFYWAGSAVAGTEGDDQVVRREGPASRIVTSLFACRDLRSQTLFITSVVKAVTQTIEFTSKGIEALREAAHRIVDEARANA